MWEIESVAALSAHLAEGRTLEDVVIQGLDLRGHEALRKQSGRGLTLLGCELDAETEQHLRRSGAVMFPVMRGLPFKPYRASLYTPSELMDGFVRGDDQSFARDTADAKIYDWYRAGRKSYPTPILDELAQRLHDHAIEDALHDLLSGSHEVVKGTNERAEAKDTRATKERRAERTWEGGSKLLARLEGGADSSSEETEKRVVAIMGGHAMKRSEPSFRIVADVARELTRRGYFLTSGGGPGAMEATQLGAWLSVFEDDALDIAIETLGRADSYKDPAWFDTAFEVLDRFPNGGESLGIPTWFYGHEPSNLFATHVAKYFSNSLREDGLLAIATHGVVYAPGSAGTIQEVFMDVAQNHYRTFKFISPMVFLDEAYWTKTKPVYPLVKHLADGNRYGEILGISDSSTGIIRHIINNPPILSSDDGNI